MASGVGRMEGKPSATPEAPRSAEAVRRRYRMEGVELSTLEAGPEGGEPILLLHGIPAGAELWRRVIGRLAEAGYHGFAPDLPGYGRTRLPPAGDRSLAGAAELLADWLRAEDLAPLWVVGHDLGGCVAQMLVVRHPELVSRLTLSHSPVGANWPVAPVRLLRALARLRLYRPLACTRYPRRDPYLRWSLRRAVADPTSLEREDALERIFLDSKLTDPIGRREFAAHTRALDTRQTLEVAPRLASIRAAVLLLWGLKDRYLPWETAGLRLRTLLGSPDIELLEEAGHFAMLDRPNAYADALLAWRGAGGG